MTREEARKYIEDKHNCKVITIDGVELVPLYQIIDRLEQQSSEWQQDHAVLKAHSDGANEVIDRVKEAREEMQKLRGCSCSCSDGIIDDVEDILDKLIAEVEG